MLLLLARCLIIVLTKGKPLPDCRADAAWRHLAAAEPDGPLDIRNLRAIVALHEPILHLLRDRL